MTQQALLIDTSETLAQIPREYDHGQQVSVKDYIPHVGDFIVGVGEQCATGFIVEQEGKWFVDGEPLDAMTSVVIIH